MMIYVKYVLFVVCLLVNIMAFGANVTPLQQLKEKLTHIKTLSAKFNQQVFQDNKRIQTSKGRFALQRPGRFRWDTKSPLAQLIVADGVKLWIFDKELEQVTVKSQKSGLRGTPALFLSDVDNNLTNDYTVSLLNKNQSKQVFLLSPNNTQVAFQSIQLVFRGNTLFSLVLKDNLGQESRVRLSNVKQNIKLKSSLFRFKPPSGVDIVNQ